MKCILYSQSIKILSRAIHSLAKIGDELIVEPLPNGLKLSTIDKAESSFSQFWFPTTFFYNYIYESEENPDDLILKISFKACLTVFKNSHSLDKIVSTCIIQIEKDVPAIIFKIQFTAGYSKTHSLLISECTPLRVKIPKTNRNEIILTPKTLSIALRNFHSHQSEITLIVNSRKTILNNFNDKTLDSTGQNIRSQLSLDPAEFTNYKVGLETSITITVKEIKAMLSFAENVSGILKIHFDEPQKPIIFNIIEAGLYEANYMLSTDYPDFTNDLGTSSETSTIPSKIKSNEKVGGGVRRKSNDLQDLSQNNESKRHCPNKIINYNNIENNNNGNINDKFINRNLNNSNNVNNNFSLNQEEGNEIVIEQINEIQERNITNINESIEKRNNIELVINEQLKTNTQYSQNNKLNTSSQQCESSEHRNKTNGKISEVYEMNKQTIGNCNEYKNDSNKEINVNALSTHNLINEAANNPNSHSNSRHQIVNNSENKINTNENDVISQNQRSNFNSNQNNIIGQNQSIAHQNQSIFHQNQSQVHNEIFNSFIQDNKNYNSNEKINISEQQQQQSSSMENSNRGVEQQQNQQQRQQDSTSSNSDNTNSKNSNHIMSFNDENFQQFQSITSKQQQQHQSSLPHENQSLLPHADQSLLPQADQSLLPQANQSLLPHANQSLIPHEEQYNDFNISTNSKLSQDTIINIQTPLNLDKFQIVFQNCLQKNQNQNNFGKILVYNSDDDEEES